MNTASGLNSTLASREESNPIQTTTRSTD